MEQVKVEASSSRVSAAGATAAAPPQTSGRKKAPAPPAPTATQSRSTRTLGRQGAVDTTTDVKRPCVEHNFLTDVADVRDMEKGLLLLLEDFHNGKLQVFGKGCTFEQMDQVRERQERLSRLHFDLDAQQQIQSIDSDDAKDVTFRNLNKLVENLDELNKSVHELKSEAIPPKTPSSVSPKLRTRVRHSQQ